MGKTLIIYHDDHDGIASAGVIAYYLRTNLECEDTDISYISANYILNLSDLLKQNHIDLQEYNRIFLVDYSISTDNNAKFILKLCDYMMDITWIDHHKSSIEMYDKYPTLEVIDGARVVGVSGTLLSYLYCFSPKILQDIKKKAGSTSSHSINVYELDDILNKFSIDIPKVIMAIHRYDIWDHRDPDTTNFHLGYILEEPEDVFECLAYYAKDIEIYNTAVDNGKVIDTYIKSQNKEYINRCSFTFSLNHNGTDYIVCALNTDRTTSLTFGNLINKYDICMAFYYNGKHRAWSYSLYTANDDIDCSAIAKVFGGGGHTKAAGFSSKEFIFKDGNMYIEN